MKQAEAIANLVSEDELNADYVIPGPFDPRVAPYVAKGSKSWYGIRCSTY